MSTIRQWYAMRQRSVRRLPGDCGAVRGRPEPVRLALITAFVVIGVLISVAMAGCGEDNKGVDAAHSQASSPAAALDAAAAATATTAAGSDPASLPAAGGGVAAPMAIAGALGGASVGGPTGDVKVDFIFPSGEVEVDATATVGFDRPMVALSAVDDDTKVDWLTITPATQVRLRWLDTRTLAIYPNVAWTTASDYVVTVGTSATAIDGSHVAQKHETRFSTPRLQIESHGPRSPFVRHNTAGFLRFSDRVDVAEVRAHWRATSTAPLPAYQIDVPATQAELKKMVEANGESVGDISDEAGKIAILRFAKPLAPEQTVAFEVTAGLRGLSGPRGTEAVTSWKMTAHGAMKLVSGACQNDCSPDSWLPFQVEFSTPIDGEERDGIAAFFEVEPSLGQLRVSCWSQTCHIGGKVLPSTDYRVVVKPGIGDTFGQKLSKGGTFSFRTGDLPPLMHIRTEGEVLERAEVPWEVAFTQRNRAIEVRLARVDADAFLAIGRAPTPRWDPMWPAASVVRTIAADKRNTTALHRLDLAKELGLSGPALVHVELLDPALTLGRRERTSRLMQITDLHVHARTWRGGALLWVTSFASGAAVGGVALRVVDAGGKTLWAGVTDGAGLAKIGKDVAAGDGSRLVVASRGDDTAILALGWSSRERSDWQDDDRIRSVAFFEKGLFKPNETAHLKVVVRRVDGENLELPGRAKVKVVVRDPQGDEVETLSARIGKHGTFAVDVVLPADARYGTWSVDATFTDRGEEHHAQASFRVAVYEPGRTTGDLALKGEHLLPGAELKANVSASWLSGGPLRDAKVELRAMGSRSTFVPSGWADFGFGDDVEDVGTDHAPIAEFEHAVTGVINAKGEVALVIPAGPVIRVAQRLTVEATITDPSGRSLNRLASAWLQPNERVAGVAVASRVARATELVDIDVASVGLDGKVDAAGKLEVVLSRRSWKTIRAEQVGGTWSWQTTVEEKEIARCDPTATTEPGARPGIRRCTFRPEQAGMYVIAATATDPAGRSRRTREVFWVSGSDSVDWPDEGERAELLVADKAHYSPGETAKILVKNPLPGALALVTVDRGGVRSERVVKMAGSTETIDVPITRAYRPNVFVSVVLFRGRLQQGAPAGLDLGAPALKIGVVELRVDASGALLDVKVDAPTRRFGPGETIELSAVVRGKDGLPRDAEVALLVVDEGVLALTGYTTPNPFTHLYADHTAGVTDYALSGQLVRRRVGEEKGDMGGGGDSAGPLLRGDFRDLAFYAPALQTDGQGRVKARFKLPDNLTAYRVMAIAVAGAEEAGAGEGVVRVGKPLMVMPRLPRFAQVGDKIELSVTVRSGDDAKGGARIAGSVDVVVVGEAVTLDGPAEVAFALDPGGATEVRFALSAKTLGEARFEVRARSNVGKGKVKDDGAVATLVVLDQRPRENAAVFGRSDDDIRETILRPAGSLDVGGVYIELASSGVAGLQGNVGPLVDYPFGCAEQTASRLLALIEMQRLRKDFALFADRDAADVQRRIAEAVERLASLRSDWPTGAFRLWPGSEGTVYPAVTAWVVEALAVAKAHGVEIPNALVDDGAAYLLSVLRQKPNPQRLEAALAEHAAALAALSRIGKAPDADCGRLFDQRAKLTRSGRLAVGLALSRSTSPQRRQQAAVLATEEKRLLVVEARTAKLPDAPDGWWSTPERDAAMLVALLATTQKDDPMLPKLVRGLVDARATPARFSTQAHAWSLLGLGAYFAVSEATPPDMNVRALLAGAVVGEAQFKGRSAMARNFFVAQSALSPGVATALLLDRDGQGPLYYGVRYETLVPAVADMARNAGLLVRRHVVAVDGTVNPTTLQRGDFAVVRLEIWSGRARRFVAVVDPLAAGLEAVDFSLSGQPVLVRRKLAAALGQSIDIAQEHGAQSDGEEGEGEEGEGEGEGEDGGGGASASFREMTPSETRFFVDDLPAGRTVFDYVVRARGRSVARWGGTRAEAMYEPEVFGRARATTIEVR